MNYKKELYNIELKELEIEDLIEDLNETQQKIREQKPFYHGLYYYTQSINYEKGSLMVDYEYHEHEKKLLNLKHNVKEIKIKIDKISTDIHKNKVDMIFDKMFKDTIKEKDIIWKVEVDVEKKNK